MTSKHFITVLTSIIFCSAIFLSSCKKDEQQPSTRTYRMGLQNSAPRFDSYDLYIQALALWVPFADATIITTEVPWDSLLSGEDPVKFVNYNYTNVVAYFRQNNLKLWVFIDPANGLNRTADNNALVAVHKSIAQQDMQKIYRRFVVVVDSLLHPDHLGLALETNLIRFGSPDSIYQGVKNAAANAAADVRATGSNVKLSISVQAEVAWGKLAGNGEYVGVAQDFIDFPFMQEMGISSYPYFNFSKPSDLPDNYYSRLVIDKPMPLFVSEGGWTSATFTGPNNTTITGSPQLQQDYITRQSQLLDNAKAIGVFQLSFTDIDLQYLPSTTDPTIAYFAYLGLVDINLASKPAFVTWKEIFARSLTGI